ncbi:CopG family transcriptional regulator [Haladaptatus sp. YSMS36]|nr:CopG family transcriptional regulator [Haladaptatus sp. YSMS36]
MHRYSFLCEEQQAARVSELSAEYGLTEAEVLRQLVEAGLQSLD